MMNKIKSFFSNNFTITAFILFAVIIFSLYGKTLSFDWTYFDDDVLILDKQDFFKFSNIDKIFTVTVFGQEKDKFCRPILNLTFLIEKYIYGTNPLGYHLTNILLHIFVVFLMFILLSEFYDQKKTFLICLLFACHPTLVQAIAWIPGRNDSLLTIFIIISFYYFIKYVDINKYLYLFFHLLCFILALLTKETAIVIPIFYCAFLFFKSVKIKKIITLIIIWSLIICLYLLYRSFVLSHQQYSLTFYELIKNFIVAFPSTTKYVANIFFPIKLSVFPATLELNYLLCMASVFVFILLFIQFKTYKLKNVIFGFCVFFFFLFPTFLMPNNQFYDHRIYLSLIGIVVVILELINKNNKVFTKQSICIFCLIFLFFSIITIFHEQKFKDKEVFWINAYLDSPKSDIANAVLAGLFLERGMYKEAEEKYLEAIKLHEFSKHYVNLAALYFKTKRLDEAEKCLLKALSLDNYNYNVYYNLALIYKIKGDKQKYEEMRKWYIIVYNDTNKISKMSEDEVDI